MPLLALSSGVHNIKAGTWDVRGVWPGRRHRRRLGAFGTSCAEGPLPALEGVALLFLLRVELMLSFFFSKFLSSHLRWAAGDAMYHLQY